MLPAFDPYPGSCFAQSRSDRQLGGAEGGQQTTDDAHGDGEYQTVKDVAGSNVEGESHLAEIRSANAGDNAIHGEGEQAAKQAAGESEENSFQHESEKDAEAGKTKSAQRSDFAGARRHEGVQGVHRAKHGANAHGHGPQNTQAQSR